MGTPAFRNVLVLREGVETAQGFVDEAQASSARGKSDYSHATTSASRGRLTVVPEIKQECSSTPVSFLLLRQSPGVAGEKNLG